MVKERNRYPEYESKIFLRIGEETRSLVDWSSHLDIEYRTLLRRFDAMVKAAGKEDYSKFILNEKEAEYFKRKNISRHRRLKTVIEVDGKLYSFSEARDVLNTTVTLTTMRRRMKQGLDPLLRKENMGGLKRRSSRNFILNGELHNLKTLRVEYGLDPMNANARYHKWVKDHNGRMEVTRDELNYIFRPIGLARKNSDIDADLKF